MDKKLFSRIPEVDPRSILTYGIIISITRFCVFLEKKNKIYCIAYLSSLGERIVLYRSVLYFIVLVC